MTQSRGYKNTLLFNEAIPLSISNRATRAYPPPPIVIEKLLPPPSAPDHEDVESVRSSVSFTALSEERLQAAVKLAKRDMRRRRHEILPPFPVEPFQEAPSFETNDAELFQGHGEEHHDPLSMEIHKLQYDLDVYIEKFEDLISRASGIQTTEKVDEESLDPDERDKVERRRRQQTNRSLQVIYVLQQQAKEIHKEIERLRSQKLWNKKKSTVMNRLAAAHRGALRILQDVLHQLSDPSISQVPPHSRQLGLLLRKLTLCSAEVDAAQGCAVPETALGILHKLETLDFVLSEPKTPEPVHVQTSTPHRKPRQSVSPTKAIKGYSRPIVRAPRGKPANSKRAVCVGGGATSLKPQQQLNRREVLWVGLEKLAQQKVKELQERAETKDTGQKQAQTVMRKKDFTAKHTQRRHGGFQKPTVSSRLRVNELPQRENSVPWIPVSPHSPPHKKSPQRRKPGPRCLFSPAKPSLNPPKVSAAADFEAEPVQNLEKEKQAQEEALRTAWLEKMTTQRLKDLDHLRKEEDEHIQNLRTEVVSPTRVEQTARESVQSLLEEAQAAETTEQLSEDQSVVLLPLQTSTLESMLLRMEQIQKDQEDVRRRFASITYSDQRYCNQSAETGPLISRPTTPQPIRLTRPTLKHTPTSDIVLEKPVETGLTAAAATSAAGLCSSSAINKPSFRSEDSLTEPPSAPEQQQETSAVFPAPAKMGREGTILSVPGSMLGSIRRYREDYNTYLEVVAHEGIGSFDPWATANSLAEEFLSEAVADVAAEFQDILEDYAEAVFTAEFLQPVPSHSHPLAPSPAAAQLSQ